MRLIDADALIDKAETVLDEHETIWFDAVSVNNIHSAPTIDAVSVVRCGECKHYDDGDCEHPCSEVGDSPLLVTADDFCSYGQKGDENVETD